MNQRQIIYRRQQSHVGNSIQQAMDGFVNVWIQMHWIDNMNAALRRSDFAQRQTNILQWRAPILATMSRHEYQASALQIKATKQLFNCRCRRQLRNPLESINHRISGNDDAVL